MNKYGAEAGQQKKFLKEKIVIYFCQVVQSLFSVIP
jgi:hypothetical protein